MRLRKSLGWVVLPSIVAIAGACGDDGGGAPDAFVPPIDASMIDVVGSGVDAEIPDATKVMSIIAITPQAASRLVDTPLLITGYNIAGGASVVLENCDTPTTYDLSAGATVAADGTSISTMLAADPNREQGIYTVTVTNPDGMSDLIECGFRILAQLPPTVTDVVPTTAWNGAPGDGILSDALVTVTGTGFRSTPSVRWLKSDGSVFYDAILVGFVSDTTLTAVVPSETLHMQPGTYHVWVTNPDLLAGQWLVPDGMGGSTPGLFTITTTPPPDILDIQPVRVENGSCTTTTLTITGGAFAPGATVWLMVPDGTICAGSIIDANGNTLCPMVVDSVSADGTTITAHFDPCPGTGPWPIVVLNPDGQQDTFFSISVTPSSDGHLNTGPFEILGSTLETARWKHASQYGSDVFGHAYFFVAGGQDVTGAVLGSVEIAEVDIFGIPGSFAQGAQYLDETDPRIANTLAVPRQGATLVRVGSDLFLIGGATTATDVASTVAASSSVERARILGYHEMPGIHLPMVQGAGLPVGSWYYQVSAIGPWGEGLPTREVVVLNQGGEITVCWSPPAAPGPTGYNVYRSLASDGRLGTTSLLAVNVPGPCFVDDGLGPHTPAPGNLRGGVTTGFNNLPDTYFYRVSAIVDIGGAPWETLASYSTAVEVTTTDLAAGNAGVQLAWDPIAGATLYIVYRWDPTIEEFLEVDTGGTLTGTVFVDDAAPFVTPGVLPRDETRPLPPGSLSLWSELPATQQLNVGREGLDGVAVELDPATTGGVVARILVAGGRSDNSGAAGTYHTTAESIGLLEDGTLEAQWVFEAPEFNSPRIYFALLTTQGRESTWFPPPPEQPPCIDADGDGFVDCACADPGVTGDCNDTDPTVYPGAPEICGDGIDQDCDLGCSGTDLPCDCTVDADLDAHYSLELMCGDDCCDDGTEASIGCAPATAPGIHPGATEICGNGIDEDCDGVDPPCICTDDLDADGHISLFCGGDDCCDTGADTSLGCTDITAPGINPSEPEICNNGIDEDCDGFDLVCAPPPGAPTPIFDVAGGEPVYVVAVYGDDAFQATNNSGRDDFEACGTDPMGHLLCGDPAGMPPRWTVQPPNDPHGGFGMDGVLYFEYLYPFYGVNRETINAGGSSRTFVSSAIGRFPVLDPDTVTGSVLLGSRQSASTTFEILRSYYQMHRLMAYVYVIGGWAQAHTLPDGTAVPEGPTGTIERHEQ